MLTYSTVMLTLYSIAWSSIMSDHGKYYVMVDLTLIGSSRLSIDALLLGVPFLWLLAAVMVCLLFLLLVVVGNVVAVMYFRGVIWGIPSLGDDMLVTGFSRK